MMMMNDRDDRKVNMNAQRKEDLYALFNLIGKINSKLVVEYVVYALPHITLSGHFPMDSSFKKKFLEDSGRKLSQEQSLAVLLGRYLTQKGIIAMDGHNSYVIKDENLKFLTGL